MADTPGPVEPTPGLTAASQLRAAAGVPLSCQVTITNTAAAARVMSLSLHGVDAAWLPAPSRSEVLAPGASVTAEIVLHPAVGTIAARYPIAVAVQALDPGTGQATGPTALAEIVLVVDAPGQVSVELHPSEAVAVFGKRIEVRLRNDGPLPAQVDLQVQAPTSARLSLQHERVEVPAASTVTVRGRIRPRRVHLFGHRARHAFTVTGRSAGAPRHAEGVLTTRAVLGPNATKAGALLAVVAVWIALAVVFVPKLADWAKPGATVHEAAGPAKTSPGASGSPGTSGSGGPSAPGSSGPGAGGPAAAKTVQLNGTVGGSSPGGVSVTMQPTSLVDEAAEGAIPVGVTTASQAVGKIPAEALSTRSAPADGRVRSVTTTGDGAWSFPAVPKPGYYLLSFAKPGFQTVRYIIDSTTADATKPLNVALAAGQGRLSGVVSGPSGHVGGAQVVITDGTDTISTSTDSTGEIGSWSVVGLSTPAAYLVSASKDGLSTESQLVTLGAGGSSNVSLTLRAGVGTVTGTVQSSAGERLGGVTVSATDGTLSRMATTVTEAGLRGLYTLSGLAAPGNYTVTFSAHGYLQQTVQVKLAAGQSRATAAVTLFPATATITGALTDKSGPLVGAGLTLTSAQQTYKTTSGSDGGYRFDGIAPGSYVLSAEYAGLGTVFKTVTVSPGSTKPITMPTFELTQLPSALSDASIVGFVSDGSNPSNTLCPAAPSTCTVTFRLADTKGNLQALAHDSVAAAPSGPTSYSLQPSAGIVPGVYRLTIAATGYLPITLRVQLPLTGIANAPPANLYPANTIKGTVRTVGDLGHTDPATAFTNCVYVVPSGSPAPDLSGCDPTKLPASQCEITGVPGPAYAEIDSTSNTFQVDKLCDGSYDVYLAITNPWYLPGGKSATLLLAHGQIAPLAVDVQRKGQLRLTMQQIDRDTRAAAPLAAGTVVNLTCSGGGAGWSPKSITVAAGATTTTPYLVGGFDPGLWSCTGAISPAGDYTLAQSGYVWMSYGQVSDAALVFTQTIGVVYGRVTTSWTGMPVGVPGGTVTISGVTSYVNQQPVTSSVSVTPDASGCFAITPDGSVPDTATAPGDCQGDSTLGASAVGKLPLVVSNADLHILAPAGYQAPADLINQRLQSTTVVAISLNPDPVTLSGLKLAPTDLADLNGFSLQVTAKPPGAGAVSLSLNTTDGSIGWQDSGLPAGQIAPGSYTLVASRSGYVTTSYSFTCTVGTACDRSGSPFTVDKLGSLTVTVTSDGSTAVNDVIANLILDGQTAKSLSSGSGNTVTFTGLTPDTDLAAGSTGYALYVQAAGFRFGDSTGATPLVQLTCGAGTSITITPGATTACTATLTPDGTVRGTVQGVLATSPATSPNQLLSGATVTLTCSSLLVGTCTNPLTGSALTFSSTTDGNGVFAVTGTKTVQGLDAGTWNLTVSYPGYGAYTSSVTLAVSEDKDLGTLNVYVTPVTFVVTALDQNKKPATGLTATLLPDIVGTEGSPANGIYTFTSVIPGSYTLELAKDGYVTATTQVQIVVGTATQTFTTYISLAANRVSGTVTATQDKSGLATPLSGATVCIVTKATDDCTKAITGTDKQTVVTTTGADGSFSFGNVPNTPGPASYYARAQPPYGWLPAVSSGFTVKYPGAGMTGLILTPAQVTNKLTVSVSSASDPSGWSPTLTNGTDSSWTFAPSASTGTGPYTFTFNQVPTGCWSFSLSLPANHYGTLTHATLPKDTNFTCTADQIAMPGTTSTAVSASYTLDEYQPTLKITATPIPGDTPITSVTLTVTDGAATTYIDSQTFTIGATATPLGFWVPPGVTVHASVTSAVAGWPDGSTTMSATSAAGSISLTENGATVTVTVTQGGTAVQNAQVTLNVPASLSFTGTTTGATGATGTVSFTVPYGTGWSASATYNDGTKGYTGSTTTNFDTGATATSVTIAVT